LRDLTSQIQARVVHLLVDIELACSKKAMLALKLFQASSPDKASSSQGIRAQFQWGAESTLAHSQSSSVCRVSIVFGVPGKVISRQSEEAHRINIDRAVISQENHVGPASSGRELIEHRRNPRRQIAQRSTHENRDVTLREF